jgi:hypothetical protein
MTAPTKSLVSPLMELTPTARDRYVSLSSNAIGAYLMVARFCRRLRVSGPGHDDCSDEVACLSFDGDPPHCA